MTAAVKLLSLIRCFVGCCLDFLDGAKEARPPETANLKQAKNKQTAMKQKKKKKRPTCRFKQENPTAGDSQDILIPVRRKPRMGVAPGLRVRRGWLQTQISSGPGGRFLASFLFYFCFCFCFFFTFVTFPLNHFFFFPSPFFLHRFIAAGYVPRRFPH